MKLKISIAFPSLLEKLTGKAKKPKPQKSYLEIDPALWQKRQT